MESKRESVVRRIRSLIPGRDRQQGQSLVIVAFLIVALLAVVGLAIDLGLMYVEKVRLGRAVDAAALAGAQELPDEGAAYDRMVEYLELNGYDENADGFDLGWAFPDEFDCLNPPCDHYHLVVSATQSVNLTFLRVLRFETVDVSAHAIGENANRLDVAIVLDVSGSMDDDTCSTGTVGHGCSPWWASSTDIFFENFTAYTTGVGTTGTRLCGASSPWSCYQPNYVEALNDSRSMSGGGNYARTQGTSADDGRFYRYINASPYDEIEIAFYERTYSCDSTSERIRGWYAPGGPWLTFMDLTCSDTWRQRVYSRATQAASSYGLQFGVYNMGTGDYGQFDNIRARGVKNGKGPSISVSCTDSASNCTCNVSGGSTTMGCSFANLAARYKAQPIWDTLNAADWFITKCKLGTDPTDPPCLDPDLDQIGLAYYSDDGTTNNFYPASGDSSTASELSSNYSAITNTLWTRFSASGWTNIGDGIYRGCEILSTNEAEGHHGRTNAVHVMILLSDGIPNRPCNPATMNCNVDAANTWSLQHITNAVNWAKQNGIIIFTISLGSRADPAVMTNIATATGGIHKYAATTDDLQAVFQDIAQHIFLRLTG